MRPIFNLKKDLLFESNDSFSESRGGFVNKNNVLPLWGVIDGGETSDDVILGRGVTSSVKERRNVGKKCPLHRTHRSKKWKNQELLIKLFDPLQETTD